MYVNAAVAELAPGVATPGPNPMYDRELQRHRCKSL
jgi:hypothetical protein